MNIIDGQIHTWLPDSPERPWTAPTLHGPIHTNEQAVALLDQAGVAGAILVPPSWVMYDNRYSLEAAAQYPGRFAVMGHYDHDGGYAQARLANWRNTPHMLGIRLNFANDKGLKLLKDSSYEWFWTTCAEAGIPLMCFAFGHLALLSAVVARYPKVRVIVDHAGRNPRGAKDDAAWADIADLLALAKLPNVAVKVSSLPCFSTQSYPFANLHPYVRAIFDAFGRERLIWGSDITRLTSTYDENLKLFTEALTFLSQTDKEAILGTNVRQWCGWKS